jgi:hypothetical protein
MSTHAAAASESSSSSSTAARYLSSSLSVHVEAAGPRHGSDGVGCLT